MDGYSGYSLEFHRKAPLIALKKNVSLNKLVETAIAHEIES